MKQPWWALLIVGVLGVGIGVGSAVLVGDDTVESSAADTTAPADTAPTDTTPASTDAPATSATTTVADTAAPTSTPATTAAPSTTGAPEPTTPDTTETPATTEPEVEQPPIEELVVAVANGAVGGGASGLAGATAELIREAGYPNVVVTNGTEPFGGTVIYVADGLQPSAERLVDDIQAIDPEFVEPAFIVPLADAPATTPALEDVDMILYLGQDQV